MTDVTVSDSAVANSQLAKTAVPTAVFYVDPRAAVFLLKETIASLLAHYSIRQAYVDLSSPAGFAVAEALVDAGVPFRALAYTDTAGSPVMGDVSPAHIASAAERDFDAGFEDDSFDDDPSSSHEAWLHGQAAGVYDIPLDQLAAVDANVVLVPAINADGVIDLASTTVLGTAYGQCEQSQREMLMVAPPERGLRLIHTSVDAERYERQTIVVRSETAAAQ